MLMTAEAMRSTASFDSCLGLCMNFNPFLSTLTLAILFLIKQVSMNVLWWLALAMMVNAAFSHFPRVSTNVVVCVGPSSTELSPCGNHCSLVYMGRGPIGVPLDVLCVGGGDFFVFVKLFGLGFGLFLWFCA